MSGSTDATLVATAVAGQIDAFAELSRRHRDTYTRFVVRMVGSRDDAEEVLQSAFVRAYRALDRCSDPARFAAWMHRIVVTECRTFIVRRARTKGRISSPPSGVPTQTALNRLDVDQREAFLLLHEGLGYEQMADVTGATVSVLKSRVKAATARVPEPVVLGDVEPFGDDFETKLVPTLLADRPIERAVLSVMAPAGSAPWWRISDGLQIPPLVAVVIVGVIAAMAAVVTVRVRPPAVAASVFSEVVYDTVHVVRFAFAGDAKSVSVVGDFNAWSADATPLTATGVKNTWSVTIPLAAGRYEYAFLVDGNRLVADPFAPSVVDDRDTRTSVVVVKSDSAAVVATATASLPLEIQRALARHRGAK